MKMRRYFEFDLVESRSERKYEGKERENQERIYFKMKEIGSRDKLN